jgi:hypothetical protein
VCRFILAHFATASAASAQLAPTLRRLTVELARAFGLQRVDDGDVDDSHLSDVAAADDGGDHDDTDGSALPSGEAFASVVGGGAGDDGGGGARMRVERLSAQFGETLRAVASRAGAGVVLLLDGCEQLTSDDGAADAPLAWLPRPLPSGVRILLGVRAVPARVRDIADTLVVAPLTPLHRALVSARRLAGAGKTLSATQLDVMASAASMASPLFARIVADELRFCTFEQLDAVLRSYVSLPDARALRRAVVKRLVSEFSAAPGRPTLLSDLFACLLGVPNGLQEAELVAAARCPPVVWALLSVALEGALVLRGELLSLADDDIVAVARELCDAATLGRARTRLVRHCARAVRREQRRLSGVAKPRVIRGRHAPRVQQSTSLIRALRMQLSLLREGTSRDELASCLLNPMHFEALWHARSADGYAGRLCFVLAALSACATFSALRIVQALARVTRQCRCAPVGRH